MTATMLTLLAACAVGADAFGSKTIPTMVIGKDASGADVELPLSGIGTWQYNSSRAGAAVTLALSLGYTHVDTAIGYDNQLGIAQALKASPRPRDSYFVTSKIPGGLNYSAATATLEQSLAQLGLKHVNLMLVHYPAAWSGDGGKELRQQGWKALEDFYKAGKAKAIGVSHFCESHIEDILEIATVKPMINQVQYHVGMAAPTTSGLNATDMPVPSKPSEQPSYKGVVYQSFSPLCGPCGNQSHTLINGPLVSKLAQKHHVSGPQIALRWLVQQGSVVVPKSANPAHIKEDFDLFSFELDASDMAVLNGASSPPSIEPVSGDCALPMEVVV